MLETAVLTAINGDPELLNELDFELLKSTITDIKGSRFVNVAAEVVDLRIGQKRKIKVTKIHRTYFDKNRL